MMENPKLKIGRLGTFKQTTETRGRHQIQTHGPVLLLEAEIPDRPHPIKEHRPSFNFVF